MGITEAVTPAGHTVKVYDRERTICDIIRKRSEMDIAVFTYAVQQYTRVEGRIFPNLWIMQQRCTLNDKSAKLWGYYCND